MARSGRGGGGFGKLVLGFVLGILAVGVGSLGYLRFGSPPVATADKPFFMEKQIVTMALNARIDRDEKKPPFGTSEDVLNPARTSIGQSARAAMARPGTMFRMRGICIRLRHSCGSMAKVPWLG